MNMLFIAAFASMAMSATAQQLPDAVQKSFDKEFPGQSISSWEDNTDYDHDKDWNEDMYFGDHDYDGFTGSIDPSYQTGGFDPDQLQSYIVSVPDDYVVNVDASPAYYQLYFIQNDVPIVMMTALFKPDGTFVIAKGTIHKLPQKVTSAIMGQFKGKTIKIGRDIEKMYVPQSPVPVYRVKVEIQHGQNHILKVDGTGKVISNIDA